MTSDYYAILGVSPAAEDVVIRAAYRALIRHYHPDSNPDPEAQERARAITEAYAVLRDAAKRAEYDSGRPGAVGDDWWTFEERPRSPVQPPAMRGVGMVMAAAAIAIVTVGAAWTWPQRDRAAPPRQMAATVSKPAKPLRILDRPPPELAPESEDLVRLGATATPPPAPSEQVPSRRLPHPTVHHANVPPAQRPMKTPRQQSVVVTHAAAPVQSASARSLKPAGAPPLPPAADAGRLATIERMSSGFYNQSLLHADAAKKQMLMSAHSRFMTRRIACHSDSCVADSYLRQIRETSAIMENRPLPPG